MSLSTNITRTTPLDLFLHECIHTESIEISWPPHSLPVSASRTLFLFWVKVISITFLCFHRTPYSVGLHSNTIIIRNLYSGCLPATVIHGTNHQWSSTHTYYGSDTSRFKTCEYLYFRPFNWRRRWGHNPSLYYHQLFNIYSYLYTFIVILFIF